MFLLSRFGEVLFDLKLNHFLKIALSCNDGIISTLLINLILTGVTFLFYCPNLTVIYSPSSKEVFAFYEGPDFATKALLMKRIIGFSQQSLNLTLVIS